VAGAYQQQDPEGVARTFGSSIESSVVASTRCFKSGSNAGTAMHYIASPQVARECCLDAPPPATTWVFVRGKDSSFPMSPCCMV